MLKVFADRLFVELDGALSGLDSQLKPRLMLREQLALVSGAFDKLEGYLGLHPFEDADAEVFYHKWVYPRFRALEVYYQDRYAAFSGIPVAGVARKKYILGRLKCLTEVFQRNSFHYDYFQLEGEALDELFFTGADPDNVLQPVLPGLSFGRSTAMGELVAVFMASERLRDDLLRELGRVLPAPEISNTIVLPGGEVKPVLKWTGGDIHLIELAHGIHLTGQVNNGEIGIVELFRLLGEFFGVNLRVPRRGFDDLKARKTMSKTAFLDSMRQAILKKMEDEDAYDPGREARKRGFN